MTEYVCEASSVVDDDDGELERVVSKVRLDGRPTFPYRCFSFCFGLKNADPKMSLSLSFVMTARTVEEALISLFMLGTCGEVSNAEVKVCGDAPAAEDGSRSF